MTDGMVSYISFFAYNVTDHIILYNFLLIKINKSFERKKAPVVLVRSGFNEFLNSLDLFSHLGGDTLGEQNLFTLELRDYQDPCEKVGTLLTIIVSRHAFSTTWGALTGTPIGGSRGSRAQVETKVSDNDRHITIIREVDVSIKLHEG